MISQASQDILNEHVLTVQEMQGSQEQGSQDMSEHSERESDEEEEDEKEIEEQWEEELELLEEHLENYTSQYQPFNTPVVNSALSLRGVSVTGMLQGTQDVAYSREVDDSVMKSVASLEITSSARPEQLEETQGIIAEVRSQSSEDEMEDDFFQNSSPQSAVGNTSPTWQSISAWAPGRSTGNNTIVYVENDNKESGCSGNEDYTTKGEEEIVSKRRESEA